MREDWSFVSPLAEVFHRRRPHTDIVSAIASVGDIVRTYDVGSMLARVVWVFKYSGFSIGQMLP
jgi:hypothetical protein